MLTIALVVLAAQGSAAEAKPATSDAASVSWVGCDISKASFMDAVAEAYTKKTGIKIELTDGGATKGIREVASKKADMGGTCRHALNIPEEQGAKLIPVAWDALVVAVHPSNPVSDLSLEQVKGIFTGKITNWKQVGGKDLTIVPMERKGKISGVGFGARQLIFDDAELEYPPAVRLFESTAPLEAALETTEAGVVITGVSSARLRKVKMLAIESKEATHANLVSGSYLLYRPLYLTVPKDPTKEATEFLKFILSDEGQDVISKTGTVNLREGKALWAKFKAFKASKAK